MLHKNEAEMRDDGYSMMDKEIMEKITHGFGLVRASDFEKIDADVAVDADDGEEVALIIMGSIKDGKLTNAIGTEIDLNGPEKESRLKKTLSEEDAEEEK